MTANKYLNNDNRLIRKKVMSRFCSYFIVSQGVYTFTYVMQYRDLLMFIKIGQRYIFTSYYQNRYLECII